jgi:hypothetical protein
VGGSEPGFTCLGTRLSWAELLRHVGAALSVLGKLDGGKTHVEPRRTLSVSARKRIASAQRARWARVRAKKAEGEHCHEEKSVVGGYALDVYCADMGAKLEPHWSNL